MSLHLSFSWVGLVLFLLPLPVNVAYGLFPPSDAPTASQKAARWPELVEQGSRIAYLLALTCLVSPDSPSRTSVWLYLSAAFLLLYHAVWLRYFIGGRTTALLAAAFCGIPQPLVVFPVLYYLCAALWLHNGPAFLLMVVFGIAHGIVSVQAFW